ncbi:MAG: T9SS type A sorting domain-containing protein [Candidatus Kapabacteria bacterium]|nr:T9SS type A sorting domain-containing protein [Candidatus Kapabacteria bacterium]
MKLHTILYGALFFCLNFVCTYAGTWDTLYTRQTNMDVGGVTFAPDDSFVIVTGVDADSRIAVTKFYRPSDGVLLDERPFWFGGFSQDGKYALIYENHGKVPILVDWRNNWQVITNFPWDSLSNTYTLSADNQTLVGFNAKGYTLWDTQTGKLRKQSQIFSDTGLKVTSLQGSALLGDSRTLCIVVNQYILNGNPKVDNSNKYYGISIDIETGEMKASTQNIRAFYAIPGSNNVIALGKKDVSKIDFNLLYQCDGTTLTKTFEYGGADDFSGRVVTFNQNPNYFIQGYAPGPLRVYETQTGLLKKSSTVAGRAQNLSNTEIYFALVSGSRLFMYNTNNLFVTTGVELHTNVISQLFPQPTSGVFCITNNSIQKDIPLTANIYDTRGDELPNAIHIISQQDGSLTLDVSLLLNGHYTLTLQQSGNIITTPVIIVK